MNAKLRSAIERIEILADANPILNLKLAPILSDLRAILAELGKPVESAEAFSLRLADLCDLIPSGHVWSVQRGRALIEQRDAAIRAEGWGDVENRIVYFEEEVAAAIADNNRPRGGQQVSFHGDFARCPTSALKRMLWWAKTFRQELRLPPAAKGSDDE